MCENIDSKMSKYVSNCSKTQEMCDKGSEKGSKMLKFVPDNLEIKKCVKKRSKKFCMQ